MWSTKSARNHYYQSTAQNHGPQCFARTIGIAALYWYFSQPSRWPTTKFHENGEKIWFKIKQFDCSDSPLTYRKILYIQLKAFNFFSIFSPFFVLDDCDVNVNQFASKTGELIVQTDGIVASDCSLLSVFGRWLPLIRFHNTAIRMSNGKTSHTITATDNLLISIQKKKWYFHRLKCIAHIPKQTTINLPENWRIVLHPVAHIGSSNLLCQHPNEFYSPWQRLATFRTMAEPLFVRTHHRLFPTKSMSPRKN